MAPLTPPRAVFLLKSPLQFLNALEARIHFGLQAEECQLVLMADGKSHSQLTALIGQEALDWGGVQWLADAPLMMAPVARASQSVSPRLSLLRKDLVGLFQFRVLARNCPDLEFVFIGDAGNPLMRHFANCARPERVVLLDDGVATLKYARWRFTGCWGEGARVSKKVNLFFKRLLLGLRDRLPLGIAFFSVYPFEVGGSDQHIPNRFTYLRESAAELDSTPEVYFLGGPLVEAKLLSEDEYFWHLQRVADHFTGRTFRYVVHRRENPERVKRIEEFFGWQAVLFDYPIEYQLARIGPRPPVLASFISSALENCQLVFGDSLSIISFRFNPEHFCLASSAKTQDVNSLYERYRAASTQAFEVIDL